MRRQQEDKIANQRGLSPELGHAAILISYFQPLELLLFISAIF
jgi:hypothetical protein